MKDLRKKVAYLQGLAEGLKINSDPNEGRVISNIIEVLDDFAVSIKEIHNTQAELESYLESIDEDLYDLEEEIYVDESHEDDDDYIEVKCPKCQELVSFDAEVLDDDDVIEVTCPNCDEVVFVNDEDFAYAADGDILENKAHEDI